MKCLILCLVLTAHLVAAEEIEFVGAVTENTAILIEKDNARKDWSHFVVQCRPENPPTNIVTFQITNSVLTLSNFAALPSGRVLIAIRSVNQDGAESAAKLYKTDIWRARPQAPKAHLVHITKAQQSEDDEDLATLMTKRRSETIPIPPTVNVNMDTRPNLLSVAHREANTVTFPGPLPTNSMSNYFHSRQTRRVNE